MGGPRPTPTNVLKARGSWRGDLMTDEPQASTDKPRCPASLTSEAKKYWRGLIPLLDQMQLLTATDRNALSRYCESMAQWREAVDDGYVDKALKLSAHCLKIEQEFGLTPSARRGLAIKRVNPNENRGKNRGQGKGKFFTAVG